VNRKITEEQVQAAVRRYWAAMADQRPGELVKMYDYEATTFNPFNQRAELGQVAAARLEREYFKPFTQFHAEITSPIEVRFLADNVAVAVHTYRSHAKNLEDPIRGKRYNRSVLDGRGTHVFIIGSEGKLTLAHQHLSDICRTPLEPAS
jgi:CRISPR/Cas system endoribonuclease Cas6 (RAMP superfamily)